MAKKKTSPPAKKPQENPFELAAVVSERVQISDVKILRCAAQTTLLLLAENPNLQVVNKVRVSVSTVPDGNLILVRPHFSLDAVEKGKKSQPAVAIECEFLLVYETDSLSGLTEPNIEAFANINGLFNAWPYWREHVQNVMARMGLPQLVIPVFRFGQ